MSTDFTLTLHPEHVHVQLAPDYEIRPEGTTQLTLAIADACCLYGYATDQQSQLLKDVTGNRGVRRASGRAGLRKKGYSSGIVS